MGVDLWANSQEISGLDYKVYVFRLLTDYIEDLAMLQQLSCTPIFVFYSLTTVKFTWAPCTLFIYNLFVLKGQNYPSCKYFWTKEIDKVQSLGIFGVTKSRGNNELCLLLLLFSFEIVYSLDTKFTSVRLAALGSGQTSCVWTLALWSLGEIYKLWCLS